MKPMIIPKINFGIPSAEDVPLLMDEMELSWQTIALLNWDNFPYKPEVKVRLAHTGNAILLHYSVKENTVAAVAESDNGHVWEDSCCEFFCSPATDDIYYNVECNAAGKVLLAAGKERNNRTYANMQCVSQIDRCSSLGSEPFTEKETSEPWELSLVIPVRCFFLHELDDLSGQSIKVNLYKCGDKLQHPHFLSMFPIHTDTPDFHRPEFFSDMVFEM